MQKVDDIEINGNKFSPTLRTLSDMKTVAYDLKWIATAQNIPSYWFFRNVYVNETDKKILKARRIRYDITVITPNSLGVECSKTKGHYHPEVPGTRVTYPEIYQVLSGEGKFMLQCGDKEVLDVIFINAEKGDVVVVPPNYGHVTINESNKPLKIANLVCSSFSSIYDTIEKRRGGAYYKLINGIIVQNTHYTKVPMPRFLKPLDKTILNLNDDENIYKLQRNKKVSQFLNNPEKTKISEELNSELKITASPE